MPRRLGSSMFPLVAHKVSAAFAQPRDASSAIGLLGSSPEIKVRLTRRDVIGERGDVQMVILEATLADPSQASRVETCMVGAHGVRIQPEEATVDLAISG
jgi:hypothetical protein